MTDDTPRTGGSQGYLRIATEEAWATQDLFDAWDRKMAEPGADPGFVGLAGFYTASQAERPQNIKRRLLDLGEERIADMDATGIDRQLLLLTAPGVQVLDTAEGVALARSTNDVLADAIRRHPDRFSGLAAIAPQDPAAAAEELRRGVTELGLSGAVVNSHTQGRYLSDQEYWPIFEAAEALDVPIYIHPTGLPKDMIRPFQEAGLDGAIYGFGVETGLHLLRIITAGVFDRFPKLRIVVGHAGEALPFWLFRLDHMHAATVRAQRYESMKPIKRTISEYMRENVYITTSGMAWEPAIRFCQDVLGADRVLYAMDYPYQYEVDEVRTHDNLGVDAATKKALYQTNAERVFGLGSR
ncbi:amidohydrolase family protein [Geodermatophilus sp. CPCC 206100]|uniref:amidohydrolase family protein n=1 Tax=Geodermatophilus sp. CPCC 206100 TaxID=3020054 RepID=UPI003B00F2AA